MDFLFSYISNMSSNIKFFLIYVMSFPSSLQSKINCLFFIKVIHIYLCLAALWVDILCITRYYLGNWWNFTLHHTVGSLFCWKQSRPHNNIYVLQEIKFKQNQIARPPIILSIFHTLLGKLLRREIFLINYFVFVFLFCVLTWKEMTSTRHFQRFSQHFFGKFWLLRINCPEPR